MCTQQESWEKDIFKILEQFKDNDIISSEPSRKKRMVFQPATLLNNNHVIFTILKFFTSLKLKTEAPHITQYNFINFTWVIFYVA